MIAILVPVLNRPQNVQPFLESVANTQEEHKVYFICSPGDRAEIKECEQSGAEVFKFHRKAGPGDFAQKINFAFDNTTEDFLFQGADDIRFRPGWDRQALRLSRKVHGGVIGTNDLWNPDVKRGRNSTHTLFARSYIEEFGSGTADNTGRVFCELYDHQYVDVEFIHTAKMRRRFVFSRNSIVEHLHPHWKRAEMDATYEKATRHTAQDRRLFMDRLILIKDQTLLERRARR